MGMGKEIEKKKYIPCWLEIIVFDIEDVITTSGESDSSDDDDDLLPFVPK